MMPSVQQGRGKSPWTKGIEMVMALCPDCGQIVELEEPEEGQLLSCPTCRARLEVLNLEPLELDWAYNEPQLLDVWEEMEMR
jgi:lysine biosynthesis protein LysW